MNLRVIRWLIENREALTKCIEIVQRYDAESNLLAKWKLVDEIARVILPMFESADGEDYLEYLQEPDWRDENSYTAMSCGAELHAMGVDWQTIVATLVPIIIAILKAIAPGDTED
jgi:hypothetical protein